MKILIDNKLKKKINRNPFNEKLIHRYFLETLYFGSNSDRSSLIPAGMKNELAIGKLALVVPEDASIPKYRPDFTLYFKDLNRRVPVEIKWKTSDFRKENQVQHIQKHGGYVVTMYDDCELNVPSVKIDHANFQDWLASRIFTLSRDALTAKNIINAKGQQWLVALRGETPLVNFKRMMNDTSSRFWAFKNSKYVVQNIFDLQKNDSMLFLFFKSSDKSQGMKAEDPKRKLTIYGWVEVSITEPYYICLQGKQSEFFEKVRINFNNASEVAERKWVHFFDFKVLNYHELDAPIVEKMNWFGDRLEMSLVESANHGGALAPISETSWNHLISQLKSHSCHDK